MCYTFKATTPHTREAWCVFTEIIGNRKSDSTCTSCVFVLGSRIHRSGSGQHASREPTMTSFDGFSRVPPPPPQDPCMWSRIPGTTTCWPIRRLHSLLFLFVLLSDDNFIIMPRNVIDDHTYLGQLVNLVEEHPALYDTSLEEYNYN